MTIKKPFVDLINILEKNKAKSVNEILPQILELATSKKKAETLRKDESGKITHIFCYYHKEWEEVKHFGKKSSSNSGYNTMCKEGNNQWTKRRATYLKERNKLLDDVASGEVDHKDLHSLMKEIDARSVLIIPKVDK